MNILIIGNGGREHALAWKVAQSPQCDRIFIAPGNAGTALTPKCKNIPLSVTDIAGLLRFAQQEHIDITIVGPEAPLVLGIVDAFQAAGLICIGPRKQAAQLEGSKVFAKEFFKKNNIPTADFDSFKDQAAALDYIANQSFPIVIKADGLAAGKGVVIAQTLDEAQTCIQQFLKQSGDRIVIESFLSGEEASFIVLVDGKNILVLPSSQDHKRRFDNDEGPNTGGMGAYSPAPIVTHDVAERIMQQIIQPTVQAIAAMGCPYTGFLYAGVMINHQGNPFLLEYNCRLGDPETQPLMMRLQTDLIDLCIAVNEQTLHQQTVDWDPRHALGVVMVAEDYPANPKKDDEIQGLDQVNPEHCMVFHAGTTQQHDTIMTCGGRVLCVTALGHDLAQAQKSAYENVSKIHWPGAGYRRDIGAKGLR